MEINPENIAQVQHIEWLNHPTTIQLLKNLENKKKKFVIELSSHAGDKEYPDMLFRVSGQAIHTLDMIIKHIKNTNEFIEFGKQQAQPQ